MQQLVNLLFSFFARAYGAIVYRIQPSLAKPDVLIFQQ